MSVATLRPRSRYSRARWDSRRAEAIQTRSAKTTPTIVHSVKINPCTCRSRTAKSAGPGSIRGAALAQAAVAVLVGGAVMATNALDRLLAVGGLLLAGRSGMFLRFVAANAAFVVVALALRRLSAVARARAEVA